MLRADVLLPWYVNRTFASTNANAVLAYGVGITASAAELTILTCWT